MHTDSFTALAITKGLLVLKVVEDCLVAQGFLKAVDIFEHLAYIQGTHCIIQKSEIYKQKAAFGMIDWSSGVEMCSRGIWVQGGIGVAKKNLSWH
jgi:hypothetical protein